MRRWIVEGRGGGGREVVVAGLAPGRVELVVDGEPIELGIVRAGDGIMLVTPSGRVLTPRLSPDGEGVIVGGASFVVRTAAARGRGPKADQEGRGSVTAQMPGRVVKVLVEPGMKVRPGDGLVILEAMKMENEVKAPVGGTVTGVHVGEGDSVESGAILVDVAGPEEMPGERH